MSQKEKLKKNPNPTAETNQLVHTFNILLYIGYVSIFFLLKILTTLRRGERKFRESNFL